MIKTEEFSENERQLILLVVAEERLARKVEEEGGNAQAEYNISPELATAMAKSDEAIRLVEEEKGKHRARRLINRAVGYHSGGCVGDIERLMF